MEKNMYLIIDLPPQTEEGGNICLPAKRYRIFASIFCRAITVFLRHVLGEVIVNHTRG